MERTVEMKVEVTEAQVVNDMGVVATVSLMMEVNRD